MAKKSKDLNLLNTLKPKKSKKVTMEKRLEVKTQESIYNETQNQLDSVTADLDRTKRDLNDLAIVSEGSLRAIEKSLKSYRNKTNLTLLILGAAVAAHYVWVVLDHLRFMSF